MASKTHEIRDPIHVFIRLSSEERELLDSRPFQRLRHIHQLALTYLVYPGATHRRFEHCLGVMELATRIYDVVTAKANITHPSVSAVVNPSDYWRKVLRAAALCHDLGHLPFSHAAEKELLPKDWTHERLSLEIILSDELKPVWQTIGVQAEHVGKVALGQKEHPDPESFNYWETILAEIITGDVFGADRMDYLLRDSHHAGVAYGRFDHHRLIDTLRILPREESNADSGEPALGIELGGIQSAEALLLARYFMYTQLYFHHVRRAYDMLLKEFLAEWLEGGQFSTDWRKHLEVTDNEVTAAIRHAARDPKVPGHEPARRIEHREHYKVLYELNAADRTINLDSVGMVFEAAIKEFGPEAVRRDPYFQKSSGMDFPVLMRDGRIQAAVDVSETLGHVPTFGIDYVLIQPEKRDAGLQWLATNRTKLIEIQRNIEWNN